MNNLQKAETLCIGSTIWMSSYSMFGENISLGNSCLRNNGIIFRWKQIWFFKHQTTKNIVSLNFEESRQSMNNAMNLLCCQSPHYPGQGLFPLVLRAPLTTPALGEQLRMPTWKRQLKERPRFSDNWEIQADRWEHGSVVTTDDAHVNRTLRSSVDGATNPWATNPRSPQPDAIQFNTTHRHFR